MNKALINIATFAAAAVPLLTSTAHAGDREWATAGKVLTGVAIGSVIARSFEPVPVYTYPQTVVVQQPVYVQQPVVIQSAPTVPNAPVAYAQPVQVVYQPVPVVVQTVPPPCPPPVYVRHSGICLPLPVVSVNFGFGFRHGHRHGW